MARRVQKVKEQPKPQEEVVEEAAPDSEQAEKLKAELDELLDEIDEVLEEQAGTFVAAYVQAGGQ